jgi:LAS superfamily LD-carboxypeptidase LdcB
MEQEVRFTPLELTGRSRWHIVDLADPPCSLHRAVVAPFRALRGAAAAAGIDLRPASSFRDFNRQLAIWNGKCRGERALLDAAGVPLVAASLDEDSLVTAILHWSALPGASRHHWGTDFDVIDAAASPPGYRPQFIAAEYAPGAVYGRLGAWLGVHAARFGFHRPYTLFRGGVQPEPWHLSHARVAGDAMRQFSVKVLRDALQGSGIAARAAVLARLPAIFERYVVNVDTLPTDAASRATRLA